MSRSGCFATVMVVLFIFLAAAKFIIWSEFHAEHFVEAAGQGDIATVRACLRMGMNPNTDTFKGASALRFAVFDAKKPYDKNLRVAALLLDHGSDVNDALDAAVITGKIEFAKLAIAKGADVTQTFQDGTTALAEATSNQDTALIKLLEHAGAKK